MAAALFGQMPVTVSFLGEASAAEVAGIRQRPRVDNQVSLDIARLGKLPKAGVTFEHMLRFAIVYLDQPLSVALLFEATISLSNVNFMVCSHRKRLIRQKLAISLDVNRDLVRHGAQGGDRLFRRCLFF